MLYLYLVLRGIYIKNKLFLEEVSSLSQRSILTLNNFHLSKANMRKNM